MIALIQKHDFPVIAIDSIDSLNFYTNFIYKANSLKFEEYFTNYIRDNSEHNIDEFIDSIQDENYKRIVSFTVMMFKDSFRLHDILRSINIQTGNKIERISNYISNGEVILINYNGGYSFVSKEDFNLSEYIVYHRYDGGFEANSKNTDITAIKNFIINGTVKIAEIVINSPTLVIENDTDISEDLKKYLKNTDYYLLNNYHKHTLLHDKKYWQGVFSNALKNGLKRIVFETTGNDSEQYTLLFDLLNANVNYIPKDFEIVSNYDLSNVIKNVKFSLINYGDYIRVG
jgi:hypothetical protein